MQPSEGLYSPQQMQTIVSIANSYSHRVCVEIMRKEPLRCCVHGSFISGGSDSILRQYTGMMHYGMCTSLNVILLAQHNHVTLLILLLSMQCCLITVRRIYNDYACTHILTKAVIA